MRLSGFEFFILLLAIAMPFLAIAYVFYFIQNGLLTAYHQELRAQLDSTLNQLYGEAFVSSSASSLSIVFPVFGKTDESSLSVSRFQFLTIAVTLALISYSIIFFKLHSIAQGRAAAEDFNVLTTVLVPMFPLIAQIYSVIKGNSKEIGNS